MRDLELKQELTEALDHGEWYWLRLMGPDGPIWRLGLYSDRGFPSFQVPDHGRSDSVTVWGDKWGVHLHKYRILRVHRCAPPGLESDPLWWDNRD